MTMTIKGLAVYPVKSMAAVASDVAEVQQRGLAGDRRWMVVDDHGRFITARQKPELTQIATRYDGSRLLLRHQAQKIVVAQPAPAQAAERSVTVWDDTCRALDGGAAVARWLSEILGMSVRLVYQGDARRDMPPRRRRQPGDHVSFADAYPLLAIGTASLRELNGRLATPVTMQHFRPNVVIQTTAPFVEDRWAECGTGSVRFAVASRCTRCVLTTVDPATGQRHPQREPLKTLSAYRRDADSGKIFFGVNLIPLKTGHLRVGESFSSFD